MNAIVYCLALCTIIHALPHPQAAELPVLQGGFPLRSKIYYGQEGSLAKVAGATEPKGIYDVEKARALPSDHVMFQGDMLIHEEKITAWELGRESRLAAPAGQRWPNGMIYYVLSDKSKPDRLVIEKAMELWQNNTCIRFVDVTDQTIKPQIYLFFEKKNGCFSHVGRQKDIRGPQTISIGRGCEQVGLIAHELGHAIGLFHHQSRPDRDQHVRLITENMEDSKVPQFKITNDGTTFGVPYDLTSIMHYDSMSFSVNGLPTLTPVNVTQEYLLGLRGQISFRDVAVVNRHYKCTDQWAQRCPGVQCENEGYVGPLCGCLCPPGTTGENCEHVTGNYYPDPPKDCGGFFTTEGVYTTSGFGKGHGLLICNWWFQAPSNLVPEITFLEFSLFDRLPSGLCYYEVMEVRLADLYKTAISKCGKEIQPGTSFTATGRDAVIRFYSFYQGAPTGAKFEIKFLPRKNTENAMESKVYLPTGNAREARYRPRDYMRYSKYSRYKREPTLSKEDKVFSSGQSS